MDTPLPDKSMRTSSAARVAIFDMERSADRADVLWTLFGVAVLVTFLLLVVVRG